MRLVGDSVLSIEAFMSRYRVSRLFMCAANTSTLHSQMDYPAALQRIRVGVPATVEHSSEAGAETSKWVAETTQAFITFMDALKLKLRAKDQLHPILQELMTGYSRFKSSKEWEGRQRMVAW
jgi:ESCRT-I complex subunit VPS28